MTTLEHAAELAELGLRVFPLRPATKLPAISEWPTRATVDRQTVSGWWRAGDPAGIGIACGDQLAPNRWHLVIDVDEHDPAHSGAEALHELEQELGALPDTVTALTPTDGKHLHYWAPVELTNAAGSNLPTGLDVRAAGGFVVAPPSTHPNGGTYQWEADHAPGEIKIAELPAAWVNRLAHRPEPAKPTATPSKTTSTIWDQVDDRPGNTYNEQPWSEILTADGWQYAGTAREGHTEWTRPGKDKRDGISATVNYGGSDVLKIFTSSMPGLVEGETYTRFGYYAATRHGGDHSAAARELRRQQTPNNTTVEHVAATPETPWPTPIPLTDALNRPPFPTWIFPDWIANQIDQASVEMQLPPDCAAQLAITALSIVAAGRARVRIAGSWTEPLNTYTVTALPPSSGKSPVFRMMLRALEEWELALVERSAKELDDYEIERKALEKLKDDAIKRGEPTEAKLAADQLRDLTPVVAPRLMIEDATPEAVQHILGEQHGRLALVSAEGGLFGMMTGRYSDKSNLDVYLAGFSGDTIRVDRIGRPSIVVRNPALTIGLTVQPAVLEALADNTELKGRGLTARFMYAVPSNNVGDRDMRRPSTYNPATETRYTDRLVDIAERLNRTPEPLELTLDDHAVDLLRTWQQDNEHRRRIDGDLADMAEWSRKAESAVVRLAGLLHLADAGDDRRPIDADTMHRAITAGHYWEAHARIAHEMWGANETVLDARRLLDWIAAQNVDEISLRDLYSSNRRRYPKAADVIPVVELLVERDWLRPLFDGPIIVGKRGLESPRFGVHPDARNCAHGNTTPHAERSITTESRPVVPHATHALRGISESSLSLISRPETLPPQKCAHGTQPNERSTNPLGL